MSEEAEIYWLEFEAELWMEYGGMMDGN